MIDVTRCRPQQRDMLQISALKAWLETQHAEIGSMCRTHSRHSRLFTQV
jgi:hypothetical protein